MEQKEAYQGKMETQLQEWGAKIDELTAKAEHATADAKARYHEQIRTLQTKREAAGEKLNELKNAGGDAWKDMKTGMESAWNDLKQALDSAIEKFK